VLYQLSYLGPMVNQPSAARRRGARYHGPRRTIKDEPDSGVAPEAGGKPSLHRVVTSTDDGRVDRPARHFASIWCTLWSDPIRTRVSARRWAT
jgi:hypothetical protein